MKNIVNLRTTFSKIGEFPSQNNRYAHLLYSAREIVQQETTEIRVTRGKIIVEFANIEPTESTNSEYRTSLLPEVKEFALMHRSNNSRKYLTFST